MKSTKKALLCSILALVLCCSMLVGTTFAWFTDSVSSKGNIIQSGTLDVEMYWADGGKAVPTTMEGWTDASTGAMFKNTLWEPGYAEAKHIMIANEGTLALNYKLRIVANGYVSKLADVIDVYYYATATATTRDVADATYLGTLAQILGAGVSSANSLYRTVNGSLEAGKTTSLTLVMKMRESAGNEYQNLSIGTDFSVELIATQMAFESDSFGSDYDAKVPDYEMPYALVRPLEELKISATVNDFGDGVPAQNIDLNTAYQFEPTIFNQHPDGNNVEDDVDSSFYKQWHADFYVYADRDIPANAIGLAGSYDLFAPYNDYNWVAITNENDAIAANQGVRLLDSMFNNPCIVTYKNLCQYANDGIGFQCGAYAINAAALAGTTMTVELRLYETTVDWTESSHGVCEETGKFITVGEFTYTFPKTASTAEELVEALSTGGTVTLTKDIVVNEKLTITTNGKATLDLNGHTLAGAFAQTGSVAVIDNNGDLTIKNGTIVSLAEYPDVDWGEEGFPTYATNTISNKGKLTIGADAVIINETAVGGASYAVDNYAGATLIVEDGAVITAKDVAIRMFSGNATMENKVVINGGTITGKRAVWVQLPSSNSAVAPKTTLEINGGVLTGNSGLAIYSYSYGNSFAATNVTITGGTFNGNVEFGGGYKGDVEIVSITGGTFNGQVGRWVTADDFAAF